MNPLIAISKVVAVLMLTMAVGNASVIYDFVGTGAPEPDESLQAEPVAFQLTLPDFINPPLDSGFLDFTCGELDSNTNCDPSVFFLKSDTGGPPLSAQVNYIFFDASNDVGYDFYFPGGAFNTPGVYSAETLGPTTNLGTLTVTETPEPTALLLVIGGMIYLCCLSRLRSALS